VTVHLVAARGAAPAAGAAVYDLAGRRVRTLPTSAAEPDVVRWDGRDASGRVVASGTYFVRPVWAGEGAAARVQLLH
jgi:hypothetical protein